MGAGASTETAPYASEKEALAAGKTQAEIDAWKKAQTAPAAAAASVTAVAPAAAATSAAGDSALPPPVEAVASLIPFNLSGKMNPAVEEMERMMMNMYKDGGQMVSSYRLVLRCLIQTPIP